MKLTLCSQLPVEPYLGQTFAPSKQGETITCYGETVDLSSVGEGESVTFDAPWLIGPVTRTDGEIEAMIQDPRGGWDNTVLTDPADGPLLGE